MSAEKNWQFELEEYICTWTMWMIIPKVSLQKSQSLNLTLWNVL